MFIFGWNGRSVRWSCYWQEGRDAYAEIADRSSAWDNSWPLWGVWELQHRVENHVITSSSARIGSWLVQSIASLCSCWSSGRFPGSSEYHFTASVGTSPFSAFGDACWSSFLITAYLHRKFSRLMSFSNLCVCTATWPSFEQRDWEK